MFDELTWRGRDDWQTKDWDCNLDRILILDDGRAIRQDYEGGSKPFPPGEPHGWINAYTSSKGTGWLEYRLKFTDGKLVEAVPDSEDAKRWDAERSAQSET